MRNGNMILAINDTVRVVSCIYEQDKATYNFKTTIQDLAKDDIVVIPTSTRIGFTCVKVVDVDVDFDIESDIELSWIVARVDRAEYEAVLEHERAVIKTVIGIERKRKQKELRAAMLDGAPTDALALLGVSTPSDIVE